MAYTKTWDETKPAGSRALNLGDDDIREFKFAIRERLQGGGMYFPSTNDNDAGLFNWVKFIEQGSNPTQEANRGFLFTKDVSGVTELFWMDSGGNVLQLTTAGEIDIANLVIASEARGDAIVRDASAWTRKALGASGTFWRSDGTDPQYSKIVEGDIDYTNLPNGALVNQAESEYLTFGTDSNANMSGDDNIPQISEGTQIISKAFTPKDTTHKIVVRATLWLTHNNSSAYAVGAIFNTDFHATNALATGYYRLNGNNNGMSAAVIEREVLASELNGASATTFTVRYGGSAGSVYINGNDGARKFGGTLVSRLEIFEYKA
jgi:hypothetical protein